MLGGVGKLNVMGKSVTDVQRWCQFSILSILVGSYSPPCQSFQNSSKEPGSLNFLPRWRGVLSLLPELHRDAKDLVGIF